MDACGPYYIASHVLMCRFTSASRSFLKRAQSRAVLYYCTWLLEQKGRAPPLERCQGFHPSALNCARAVKHFDWRYGLADQLLCGSRFYKPAINFSARGLLKLNYGKNSHSVHFLLPKNSLMWQRFSHTIVNKPKASHSFKGCFHWAASSVWWKV
jgi:hypothetical protein